MISDERAEKALEYLVKTDEQAAALKAAVEALNEKRRMTRSVEFLKAQGSAAERTETAYASEAYLQAVEDYENAVADYEVVRNRRQTAAIMIDMYRTESANQRKGNV